MKLRGKGQRGGKLPRCKQVMGEGIDGKVWLSAKLEWPEPILVEQIETMTILKGGRAWFLSTPAKGVAGPFPTLKQVVKAIPRFTG